MQSVFSHSQPSSVCMMKWLLDRHKDALILSLLGHIIDDEDISSHLHNSVWVSFSQEFLPCLLNSKQGHFWNKGSFSQNFQNVIWNMYNLFCGHTQFGVTFLRIVYNGHILWNSFFSWKRKKIINYTVSIFRSFKGYFTSSLPDSLFKILETFRGVVICLPVFYTSSEF